MRSILNLSLPQTTSDKVKKQAKNRGFSSVSSYVRFLLELDEGLISADDLLMVSTRANAEYRKGKLAERKSLAELMDAA